MSVSINFEIPVVTSGRTPGTKTLRALTAYLTVAVDVLSIDLEEAPVAATVKNQELRVFGGNCFRRLGPVPQAGALLRIESDTMHPDLLAVTDYRKNDSEVCRKVAFRTKLLQHPAGISDFSSFNILDLDQKPVEGQLRSFASRSDWWMITDGFLYYKIPEPLISLEVERGYGEPGPLSCKVATLESILANLQQFRSRRTVGIYSLAQMDDAMARAENLVTNHRCVAERLTVPVSVTRRDLFETRPLELNAAAFAAFFLYYFFDYRLPFIDKRRLAEVVRLGTERLSLVSELDENLTAFLEGRSTTSLIETVTSILDLPDSDPLWEKYSPFWVEHRGFVRHCLDDRIVIADFRPQG